MALRAVSSTHKFAASLAFLLSVGLGALTTLPANATAEVIPPGLDALVKTEQRLLSREVNTDRILSPTDNQQDPAFAPEAGNTFEVESYWVDADQVTQFDSGTFEPKLRAALTRTHGGKQQVRLLVHPESRKMYAKLVATATKATSFKARATSSSRTLLVWEEGKEASAFFAKLSLDAQIGGTSRTVSSSQVVRSVGISKILDGDGKALPDSFGYFPEPWGFVPKGMDEAGMLVRSVPEDIASGKTKLVPLFALYAEPKDGAEPLLRGMIRRSGMQSREFVKEKILRPFARQWAELVFEHGITSEPHAQNVLLEVDSDGQPTGRFFHRDFGGFAADLKYRGQLGIAATKNLPLLTTLEKDYRTERTQGDLGNLEVYFAQGFVYNIDKALARWGMQGSSQTRGGWFKGLFGAYDSKPATALSALEEVADEEYSKVLGKPVKIPVFLHLAHHTGVLRADALAIKAQLATRRASRARTRQALASSPEATAKTATKLSLGTRELQAKRGSGVANDNHSPRGAAHKQVSPAAKRGRR